MKFNINSIILSLWQNQIIINSKHNQIILFSLFLVISVCTGV